MKITILTQFPEMFVPVLGESILGRASKQGILEISVKDVRDYSADRHRKTDDTPFGGGAGMLMAPQPAFDAPQQHKNQFRERTFLASDAPTWCHLLLHRHGGTLFLVE